MRLELEDVGVSRPLLTDEEYSIPSGQSSMALAGPTSDGGRKQDSLTWVQRATSAEQTQHDDAATESDHGAASHPINDFRVYKRRWFGLIQLVLLNIIVSWDWLSFSAVSTTSAEYFQVSESAINWLSTSFLFSFVFASPAVLYTLNKGGPRPAIIISSVLILLGNWLRYVGARASGGHFGVVMFGQILTGLAQPFVLAAPTRYSDLWFTAQGRISATAVASLANPFGGALGQLIDPFWAVNASDIPNMVLYIAIIATVACIPSFFIPARPPTPPCPSAAEAKIPLSGTLPKLVRSVEFWLVFIPFSIYVALFNAFSTLLNQILSPYDFSETSAGICGALLIVTGLLASAATSPYLDRHKHLTVAFIKTAVPVIGLAYLAFVWAPGTRSAAAPYVIAAVLGGASFSLVPIALEWLVDVTHPVSPEITSVGCWAGGQLLGGVFLLAMDALKMGEAADPPFGMGRALVFQAVVALAVVPLPLFLGVGGRAVRASRIEADRSASSP
ncbi:MAG: hypothetical protein M1825_005331 [Sarcosagium campestre]|nr:MAG: hypothetical protein M1825_005331 [Sarcosagium campestre]